MKAPTNKNVRKNVLEQKRAALKRALERFESDDTCDLGDFYLARKIVRLRREIKKLK